MPSIITIESGLLVRICPTDPRRLQCSRNKGANWADYAFCMNLRFQELIDDGGELLAITDKGLYGTNNKGRTWVLRHR